jgi:hypothetical protein
VSDVLYPDGEKLRQIDFDISAVQQFKVPKAGSIVRVNRRDALVRRVVLGLSNLRGCMHIKLHCEVL